MIFSSLGAEHLWCKASTPPKSLISLCCICFCLKQLYSAIANSWVELTHFFCLQVWMSIKFGGWQWYKCAVRDGTPTLKSHWSKSLLIVIKYQILWFALQTFFQFTSFILICPDENVPVFTLKSFSSADLLWPGPANQQENSTTWKATQKVQLPAALINSCSFALSQVGA